MNLKLTPRVTKMDEYTEFLKQLAESFQQFTEAAEKGEKRKNSALEARKLSHKIGKDMAAFRKLSVSNDASISAAKKTNTDPE